ncbi:MAG TPA: ABC transporter ATP-binding protein [Bryobacteraceae bacterium]|nr:ABC transporter ATP-binding protein [Bryobacteraceae bacterium]
MSDALTATDLRKQFRNAVALEHVSLTIPAGSVFGLVGPNGAGKTTMIKILMNILSATSGEATVLGVNSANLGQDDYCRIGYVSENQDMPDWMTVSYFLRYLKEFYPSWDEKYVAEVVRQFDLPAGRELGHLSRGMRMKVALVSCLAYRPRLLVLDEPFSGLDPLVREDLIEGLLDIAGETTMFISSHDLAEIESFASHIGYLDRGILQFSEEMTSLSSRFREVEVTLDPASVVAARADWPASWMRPESSSAVVRFVETRFDPERTNGEIRRLFGDVKHIAVNPMSLRAIFITIARSGLKAA